MTVKEGLRSILEWAVIVLSILVLLVSGIYAKEHSPDIFGKVIGWIAMSGAVAVAGFAVHRLARKRKEDQ